jgi:hypothetical protein
LRKALWWSAWLGVAALFAWAFVPADADAARPASGSPVERLLGPIAGLAASVQWVRFDVALRRGDTARAYARAEGALRLDPREPRGWIFLARHLVYERGSLLREPDREARARWIEAGLDTLRRGESRTRDPGSLLFERGVVLAFQASLSDEDRAFPRGEAEAWELAAEAFEKAAATGTPGAARAAELARERAARAGR